MTKTWKVTYYPTNMTASMMGVALVEAVDRSMAMFTFRQQYAGQFHTVADCVPLGA